MFSNPWSIAPNVFGIHFQLLTGIGNFSVPADLTRLGFSSMAAGGGGGGVAAGTATASGGLAGTLVSGFMTVIPGALIPYSCGIGGAGGAAGNHNGIAGGDTTLGSIISKGGPGGIGSGSGNAPNISVYTLGAFLAGSSIIPSSSLWSIQSVAFGGLGGNGALASTGGEGRASAWGLGGSPPTNAAGNDADPLGYGAAGSGAGQTLGASALPGGKGSNGAIVLFW